MVALLAAALARASAATGGDVLGALRTAVPPWGGAGNALNPGVLGWLFPVVLLVGYLPGWAIEQDLWLRIQSAPSTGAARRGALLGLVTIGVFVIAIPALVAFAALVVFPPVAGAPPAAIGEGALGILPAFISGMGPVAATLMVLGIVACQMSTVDTFANVTAMPLCYDLLEPLVLARRKRSRAVVTRWAQLVSGLAILLGLGYALVSSSLTDVYFLSSGVLSACIAVPALAMFLPRANTAGVLAAIVAGLVGTGGTFFFEYHWLQATDPSAPHYFSSVLPPWLAGSYGYLYVGAGVALSVFVLVVVSLLTAPSPAARRAAVHAAPVEGTQALEVVSEGDYGGTAASPEGAI
jgi:SSS family solute:Na+ symporter